MEFGSKARTLFKSAITATTLIVMSSLISPVEANQSQAFSESINTGSNPSLTNTVPYQIARVSFPIRGQRETRVKHKGYMSTTFTLYPDGRLTAVTGTWNRKSWVGFTGGVQVILTDKQGYPIWHSALRTYGVDGRRIGRSSRDDAWNEQVPRNILDRVGGYAIYQRHTPTYRVIKWFGSRQGLAVIKTLLVLL